MTAPSTPNPYARGGAQRHGRVYSLLIEGAMHNPADFNEIGVWNPGNLNKDARKVAAHAARVLGVEVEIVKHLAGGDRVEGWYR